MQAQQVQTQDENSQDLQRRIAELTAENILLKEQLASKEQFTAMIAHDLRGPLTPIINYAKLIIRRQNAQPNSPLHRHANIIISQAQRMTRLVGDLLDMSRLSAGKFTLIRDQCDIIALVIEVAEQLRPVAPHHKLFVDVPEGMLVGTYDSERLQQAIGNLIDNAIKYSYEETIITIRVWTTSNTIHVSVHNVGRPISADEIDQLFLPFVRLQSASTRKGSGLGLFIAKSIITAHGGDLGLEPYTGNTCTDTEQQCSDTTFSFTLPYEASPSLT
ncbi:MAG: hypothetical protein NVS4B12_11050 [Ktedonobacteraceae bacterium]